MKLLEPTTSIFEVPVKLSASASVSKEQVAFAKKAFESIASEHLHKYIPNVDLDKNPDLLPVAFDSCIANLVNANDDAMVSSSIVALAETCNNKYINYEHDKFSVIGFLQNYGFHSFSDKSELTKEEALATNEPFYLSLGGVVWKVVDQYTSEAIQAQSVNINSHGWTVHASWEVSFSEYVLATGSKKIQDATIVDSDEEIKEFEKYLRINGGSGYLPDGRPIYRVINDPKPLFLGIGFTYNPAAAVDKVITASTLEIEKIETQVENNQPNNENLNNISQEEKFNVKAVSMKLHDIDDINEDSLKVAKASEIREFIKSEFQKKDQELIQAKEAAEAAKLAVETEKESIKVELEASKTKISDLESNLIALQSDLAAIRTAQEEQEREQSFSSRMSEIESEYNLEDEKVKAIVASKIKSIASDDDFNSWKTEFALLGVGLKKAASQSSSTEDAASKAIATASVDGSKIPVGVQGGQQSTATKTPVKVEVSPKGFVTI